MRGVRAAPTAPGQAARFRQVFACRHHPTALSAPSCRLNLAGAPAACSRRPLSKPCWTSFQGEEPGQFPAGAPRWCRSSSPAN